MIIIIQNTQRNIKAARALTKSTHKGQSIVTYPCYKWPPGDSKDTQLVIMDLSADMVFQRSISGREFARDLVTKGMPKSIKIINLYVSNLLIHRSELEWGESLWSFSCDLVSALFAHDKRRVDVRYISSTAWDYTLLIPPKEDKQWQVCGLNESTKVTCDGLSQKDLVAGRSSKVLWSGSDPSEYIRHNICNIKSIPPSAAGEKQSERKRKSTRKLKKHGTKRPLGNTESPNQATTATSKHLLPPPPQKRKIEPS